MNAFDLEWTLGAIFAVILAALILWVPVHYGHRLACWLKRRRDARMALARAVRGDRLRHPALRDMPELHPERAAVPLTADRERLLGELDARTWPEPARDERSRP